MIDIARIRPEKKLFHNEKIPVYSTNVHIDEIFFWPANARNILDFDLLTNQKGKKLDELNEIDIVRFLSKQPRLKLGDLKRSIEKNGVRVPLIILDDGTLLDGNRRYFACKLLQYEYVNANRELPEILQHVPVYVIKNKDIDEIKKEKILAEANFVPDYKVEWTLDVKAKVIREFYEICKKKGMEDENIFEEIVNVYSVQKRDAKDYIEALKIADKFLNASKNKADELKRRQILQGKFVYFWEFYNKATKSRSALDEIEFPRVRKLFFEMMLTDKFEKMKQIEPMIRAFRDDYLWELLIESKGSKIDLVEALYMEKKALKSIEDKIRNFSKWVTKLSSAELTKSARKLLQDLIQEIKNILSP